MTHEHTFIIYNNNRFIRYSSRARNTHAHIRLYIHVYHTGGQPILHDVIHAHALRNTFMLGEFTCKIGMSKKEVRYSFKKHLCIFFDSLCRDIAMVISMHTLKGPLSSMSSDIAIFSLLMRQHGQG